MRSALRQSVYFSKMCGNARRCYSITPPKQDDSLAIIAAFGSATFMTSLATLYYMSYTNQDSIAIRKDAVEIKENMLAIRKAIESAEKRSVADTKGL